MKLGRLIISSFMFIFTLVLFNGCELITETINMKNAFITLDINPSIEILTDDEGLVAQVNAINEDAEVLLLETDFIGKTVDETIETIINLATELGYIDITAENAIVISALSEDDESTTKLEDKINDIIKKQSEKKEIKMEIIKARQEAKQEMKDLAASLNVSIGKLKLMQVAVELDPTLTLEQAATMSVRELNNIVKTCRNEMKDLIKDEVRQGFLNLKNNMHYALFLARVEYTYEAIEVASDDRFVEILAETEVTVDTVKELYKNYYDELVVLKDSYDEVLIEATINSNQEIIDLLLERLELEGKVKIEDLAKGKGKHQQENRKEFMENRLAIKELDEQITIKLEEIVETLTNNPVFNFKYIITDDNNIDIRIDYRNDFNFIKEKYEQLFSELGIELDSLEELFFEDVKEKLNEVKLEFNDKIDELKENAKSHKDEFENEMKKQHQYFKDLWENTINK